MAKITADQVDGAIQNIDAWANLIRIPRTRIDDVFREGWSKLHDTWEKNKDKPISQAIADFLNWTPLFGEADTGDVWATAANPEPAHDGLLRTDLGYLERCRSVGQYQFE